MSAAIVFGPGEGVRYEARGSEMFFKATAENTKGAFSLMERTLPPGGRPTPAHRHPGPEAFFVLDGRIDFDVSSDAIPATGGTFVLVPAGTAHTFANSSPSPARLLILHAPAADAYFAELQQLWSASEPPTRDAERALQRKHGWESA